MLLLCNRQWNHCRSLSWISGFVVEYIIYSAHYFVLFQTIAFGALADIYSAPVGEQSIAISLSVSLSVHEHISGTAGQIFMKFCVQIACGCGSVLLWRRCDTLCTSGYMDDVTFGRNGPYGIAWPAWSASTSRQLCVWPGRSLMSMNARWTEVWCWAGIGGGGGGAAGAGNYKDYTTQYAKSGQSTCRGCETKIDKVRRQVVIAVIVLSATIIVTRSSMLK